VGELAAALAGALAEQADRQDAAEQALAGELRPALEAQPGPTVPPSCTRNVITRWDEGMKFEADAFEQALAIRKEIGDLVGVAISLNNLGTVAQDQRDDVHALAIFKEAYEVAKETGDRNRIALVLTNLGETLSRLNRVEEAIAYLKQAEELFDELGDRLGLAEAVRGLGKAYLAQRDFTRAREHIGRAVELFRAIDSRVQLGIALRSLGEISAAGAAGGQGVTLARDYLKQSIDIFEQAGNAIELARSCRAYAELLVTTMEYQMDPAVAAEAQMYGKRAEAILARQKQDVAPRSS
jgi:tetratricopeptide (TPR) repeat protein